MEEYIQKVRQVFPEAVAKREGIGAGTRIAIYTADINGKLLCFSRCVRTAWINSADYIERVVLRA